MNPLDVIAKSASIEGYEHLLNRETLVDDLVTRAAVGKDLVLTYGDSVFTVELDTDAHEVHIYSLGVGSEAVGIAHQFMKELWEVVPFDQVSATVNDERLIRIMKKLGWQETGGFGAYFKTFIARRPT